MRDKKICRIKFESFKISCRINPRGVSIRGVRCSDCFHRKSSARDTRLAALNLVNISGRSRGWGWLYVGGGPVLFAKSVSLSARQSSCCPRPPVLLSVTRATDEISRNAVQSWKAFVQRLSRRRGGGGFTWIVPSFESRPFEAFRFGVNPEEINPGSYCIAFCEICRIAARYRLNNRWKWTSFVC